ncbi:hypothetical protein EMCRGX_G020428 [Ephydatia muelleri]
MISSCFATAYGVSKFLSSVLSDHTSATFMLSLCLGFSGLCCILFPLAGGVWLLCALWFVQGITQGLGWPACAKILREWYPRSQLGMWWSILSSSGNVSSALLPVLLAYFHSLAGWQFNFYVIGAAALAMSAVVLMIMKDSPSLAPREQRLPLPATEPSHQGPVGLIGVLYSVDVWLACALRPTDRKPSATAASITTMHIGGVFGNLSLGYLSDLIINRWPQAEQTKAPRAPALLGITILLTAALELFPSTVSESSSHLWLSFLWFSTGFLVEGGISTVSLLTIGLVPDNQSGSAHGLACLVAQGGAFMAGWPFSRLVEGTSWKVAYQLLVLASGAMVAISSYFMMLLLKGLPSRTTRKFD